jgi:hypothetical protein
MEPAPPPTGCYQINYLQGFENIGGGEGVLIKSGNNVLD